MPEGRADPRLFLRCKRPDSLGLSGLEDLEDMLYPKFVEDDLLGGDSGWEGFSVDSVSRGGNNIADRR